MRVHKQSRNPQDVYVSRVETQAEPCVTCTAVRPCACAAALGPGDARPSQVTVSGCSACCSRSAKGDFRQMMYIADQRWRVCTTRSDQCVHVSTFPLTFQSCVVCACVLFTPGSYYTVQSVVV